MKRRVSLGVWVMFLLAALALPMAHVHAREQGAVLAVEGTTTAVVGGERMAAAMQGEEVAVAGASFIPGELVGLWVTFEDGAVFGVDDEGIVADGDGTFAVRVMLDASLPVGPHTLSARGKTSGLGAAVAFVLLPGSGPAPTTGVQLTVQPASARQLETVTLNGSGFGADEAVALWLTLPNGAVIGLGQVTAATTGTIAEPLTMPGWLPVGRYSATAQGRTSGATAIAEWRLDYGNGLNVEGARLAADLGRAVQQTVLRIAASGFTPGESVSFWQTLPDGAVAALGELRADDDGNLAATLYLSESLPTGTHYLSFRSNTSNQAGFAQITLEPGPVAP